MTGWRRLRFMVAFIAGCGGLVAGVVFAMRSAWFLSQAERVDAVVVQLTKARRGKLQPVVAYWVGGKEYRVKAGYASSPPSHGVGDAVGVLYVPGRPEGGHVSPYAQLWLTPLVSLLLGGIFTCAGLPGLHPKRVAEPGAALDQRGMSTSRDSSLSAPRRASELGR